MDELFLVVKCNKRDVIFWEISQECKLASIIEIKIDWRINNQRDLTK